MAPVFTHGMVPPQNPGLFREGVPPETTFAMSPTVTRLIYQAPSHTRPSEPFLFATFDLLDALGHRQVFRHGAAQFVNGLADLAAHFLVDSAGVVFVPHILAAELFLGLRGTEQIGGQLRAAHVVEDAILAPEPLALVDVAHPQGSSYSTHIGGFIALEKA